MSNEPVLTFHGAAGTVTGACFEVVAGRGRVLVDCGMFQGPRTLESLNAAPFEFDPRRIDAVVLTHAHIDHSGLLPRLVREGFAGPIWCTAPTRDLLKVMLPDSARIQEFDAERRNRRPDRRDEQPIQPIYTAADADATVEQARVADLEQWFEPVHGIRVRLWNAGHILGSASAELEAGGTRLLFSGDIGPEEKAFHADPDAPQRFDHVVCESTYGDRDRPAVTLEERRALLGQEVRDALARGGNLVIPVFAVERTQELLLDIASLIDTGALRDTQVFVDSPLASRVTEVFATHRRHLEDLNGGNPFRRPSFHFTETAAQSMRLNDMSGAVILSASGMCEAGRIRHHLLHNLPRGDSTILFVGFQAAGTLGRAILDGARRVRLSGRDVAVKARIRRIDSYSAHADRSEILDWITARSPIRGSLFLSHGEPDAAEALQQDLAAVQPSVLVPTIGEAYALPAGSPARRLRTGRKEVADAATRDWQNDYAELVTGLKSALHRIEGDRARRHAIAEMRAVLERFRDHRDGRR